MEPTEVVSNTAVIIAGIIAIIGALVSGIVTIIITLRTQKQTGEIKILVDGRYGDVLNELAIVRQLLANSTGIEGDQVSANKAKDRAAHQQTKVNKVEGNGKKTVILG